MKLSFEEVEYLLSELHTGEYFDSNKIPEIDLYMDQVIQLFENHLSYTKRYEEDKILTKTMINNYSKEKILLPTINKKYSKEHIILMLLTYDLKQIMSINDIKKLFNPIVEGNLKENESIDLISLYDKYLILKEKQRLEEKKYIASLLESVEEIYINDNGQKEEYEKTLLILLSMINIATDNKRLTEKILDNYF